MYEAPWYFLVQDERLDGCVSVGQLRLDGYTEQWQSQYCPRDRDTKRCSGLQVSIMAVQRRQQGSDPDIHSDKTIKGSTDAASDHLLRQWYSYIEHIRLPGC